MSRKYFGTDGIRDVAGEGLLTRELVGAYGRALGAFLREVDGPARVLAGRDTRASGPWILEEISAGLSAHGHRLVDGGVLTTPAVQTLVREEDFSLALVISASHNPAADNGIKFFGADGRKLKDASERALEGLFERAVGGTLQEPCGGGTVTHDHEAGDRYVKFLRSCLPDLDLRGVRLVLDCAHGAAYRLGPQVLREFGAELTVVGDAPDGNNINSGVGVFNVDRLAPLVASSRAALGLALDGDADRVLLLDEAGRVRDGDHMLGVLAHDLQARNELPGHRLVTTVMANLGLKVFLRTSGVDCDMVPVGDRYVAARMDAADLVLGGEQSGHVIFRSGSRWFGDGVYTALRILEVMKRRGLPLSVLAEGIEKYPQRLVNLQVASKPPLADVPELQEAVREAERALGDTGRVLLRYSGTESLLRVMVEGKHEDRVEALVQSLVAVARRALGNED